MKQPIRKKTNTISKPTKRTVKKKKTVRKHPQFGTSKLEQDFAREFLDKLGVKYIWQFPAKEIGRFFDYAIFINGNVSDFSNGNILLLEIDGSFFHSDPRLVKEEEMNPMQKRNKRVDEYKNKWALEHGIPIMRIWEKDIRETPNKVMKELKDRLYIEDKKQTLLEKKNKRHVNKMK